MSDESPTLDPGALEYLIYHVRGVQAARLVVDAHGKIEEVHVIGTPDRSAKQIVRDIESILFIRGGVRVDHRKISLVQMADTVVQSQASRILLVDVATDAGEGSDVVVTLSMGDQQVQGVGRQRPDEPASSAMLVAYATLHALGTIAGARGTFNLEQLQFQRFGDLPVCLCRISLVVEGGVDILLGISVVREDDPLAVARAVLNATNRRLERLLSERR
jgi:hypothetical protein